MSTLAVATDLDVLEHCVRQFDLGLPFPAIEHFNLHLRSEGFDLRVVKAVSDTAEPGNHADEADLVRDFPRRELGLVIRVHYSSRPWPAVHD